MSSSSTSQPHNGAEDSPLLPSQSKALIDPTFGSSGVIAKEIGEELQRDQDDIVEQLPTGYGSTADLEENPIEEDSVPVADLDLDSSKVATIIFSLLLGAFLAALDTTIVTTLLTTIASKINAVSRMQWIATSYFLSCSAFQPLYGKLSDIFGRRSLLLFSNITFALGCLICGIANSLWCISLGRFITGIGAGGLTMMGTITLSDLVPLRKRGIYQGLANVAFGLGAASGGLLGSVFESWFNWQAAFLFQVPVALLSALIIYKNLNLPRGSAGFGMEGSKWELLKHVDFLGSSLLVTSLLSFMVLISFIGKEIAVNGGYFWILTALTVLPLFAFGYVELYVAETPIIPVRLLALRTVLSSSLLNWFMSMSVFSYLFYLPVFWSSVTRLTPTEIGLRTISNFAGVSMGSFFAGIYMRSTGKYMKLSLWSGLLTVAGTFAVYNTTRKSSEWFQYLVLLAPGFGYASLLTVTLLALIAAVPQDHQAATTSIQYAFRATGSTVGISAASFIFQYYLSASLNEKLYSIPGVPFDKNEIAQIIENALQSSEYTWNGAPVIFRNEIIDSYDFSTHRALLFSFICSAIAWVVGWGMKEHHLHTGMNRKD
ncbi:hypothetical protein WICPIJ_000843 [Wickerhamomyces pijperi]|uniref:Major facilitator superfamily (MFS) profile domain-containing protein n=1 Tax=Wickerhamomyces pijperi TaxID=599730 RepID=A0A9P8TR81_WICPI|nr:hypothetical protein WICPIJ_000843 [Wickerhamomyces pijperi]